MKDLREASALYVAARRKGVQTRRFKLSNARFAVVAEGLYDRKIQFIAAGNIYYTRRDELEQLFKAAQSLRVHLDYRPIGEGPKEGIFKAFVAQERQIP